jgi:hypothetical protein
MKNLLGFFKSMLSDEKGSVSSKRVVGIMCSITLCFTLAYSLFTKTNNTISPTLIESVALLAFGCLGLTSLDKFTFGKRSEDKTEI